MGAQRRSEYARRWIRGEGERANDLQMHAHNVPIDEWDDDLSNDEVGLVVVLAMQPP